jgi:hypothetical protein
MAWFTGDELSTCKINGETKASAWQLPSVSSPFMIMYSERDLIFMMLFLHKLVSWVIALHHSISFIPCFKTVISENI